MSYNHFGPNQKINKRAIAWALFSQSIWMPVLVIDSQDQLASNHKDYDFTGVASNIPHQNYANDISHRSSLPGHSVDIIVKSQENPSSGVLLNTILPKERTIQSKIKINNPYMVLSSTPIALSISPRTSSIPSNLNLRASSPEPTIDLHRTPRTIEFQALNLLERLYTRSDLLGGSLTLADINEPQMPPVARAEKAQALRMGDPLATIPSNLREPMRRALQSLSENLKPTSGSPTAKTIGSISVEQARVIHIPSARIKRFSEVPLALQSDGTVDILNKPEDPDVVEEIKSWSSKQQLPNKGSMAPAVVHLHPLPEKIQSPETSFPKNASQSNPELVLDHSTVAPASQGTTKFEQESSIPNSAQPTTTAPLPPPPVIESRTSNQPPVNSLAPIAEVHTAVPSIPASSGEVQ
jgi:hypothetical protein